MNLIQIGDKVRVFGFRERWALNRVDNSFFKTLWMTGHIACFPSNEVASVMDFKDGHALIYSSQCLEMFWIPEEILELVEVAG